MNQSNEWAWWCGPNKINVNPKSTTRKPEKSTIALFQMLQHTDMPRCGIEDILFLLAQDRENKWGRPTCKRGYQSALLSYHLLTKRLKKERKGRKVFYSLTQRGHEYAKERGIF
jgi:hypothetical protein